MKKFKSTAKSKEQYLANRQNLIVLSASARMLIAMGHAATVNEGLQLIYRNEHPEINEFNTFNQWKEKGYSIEKGSKAFLVWGSPRDVKQTPDGAQEPEEYKYWPLCYLFADTQVRASESQPAEVVDEEPALIQ